MKPVCQLARSTMVWMILTILMVILPFAGNIQSWIYVLALLTISWRLGWGELHHKQVFQALRLMPGEQEGLTL